LAVVPLVATETGGLSRPPEFQGRKRSVGSVRDRSYRGLRGRSIALRSIEADLRPDRQNGYYKETKQSENELHQSPEGSSGPVVHEPYNTFGSTKHQERPDRLILGFDGCAVRQIGEFIGPRVVVAANVFDAVLCK
jgi:hypothetical protein